MSRPPLNSYPRYAASILAGNDLFRSTFASVFPLFGTKYFNALTIGGGSTLLAGISILMMPLLYVRCAFLARPRSNETDPSSLFLLLLLHRS